VCPDLRGTLRPPVKGHEIKKDISILFSIFSFSGAIYVVSKTIAPRGAKEVKLRSPPFRAGNSGFFSQRPRPSGRGLKKGNNSLAASIPTLPGGALKGGGK